MPPALQSSLDAFYVEPVQVIISGTNTGAIVWQQHNERFLHGDNIAAFYMESYTPIFLHIGE